MIQYLLSLSLLILAVLLIRSIFRKTVAPRMIYALWLVVVIRMFLPVSLLEVNVTLPAFLQNHQTVEEEMPEDPADSFLDSSDKQIQEPTADLPQRVPDYPQQNPVLVTPVYPNVSEKSPEIAAPVQTVPDISETDKEELSIPADPLPAPPTTEPVSIQWQRIADLVWFVGAVVSATWFLFTGITYNRRLIQKRILHRTVRGTKVYISEDAGVPCISGLIPSIYITPEAANSTSEMLIIIHEHMHLRHWDHIWSIVRALALTVFWWNPLVWAAATVSKLDAELACDDAISVKLNEETRLKYAHILLDTIPQKHRYATGLGSAPMKERILMLTKQQKNRWISFVLSVVLAVSAVGCSFVNPHTVTMDNILAQDGFTILSQETKEISLSLPLEKLPSYDDIVSSEGAHLDLKKIPVFTTDTTKVFLHTVGVSAQKPEEMGPSVLYLGFDIRHTLSDSGTVYTVNRVLNDHDSLTYRSEVSVTEKTLRNSSRKIRLMGSGPADTFHLYIDADMYSGLHGKLNIGITLNEIVYERGNEVRKYSDPALLTEPALPDNFAEIYHEAEAMYAMFTRYRSDIYFNGTASIDGIPYRVVNIKAIMSFKKLSEYLEQCFDAKLTEKLIATTVENTYPLFAVIDGWLHRVDHYTAAFEYDVGHDYTMTLESFEDGKYTVRVEAYMTDNGREIPATAYCTYTESADGEIRFTSFELMAEKFAAALEQMSQTPDNTVRDYGQGPFIGYVESRETPWIDLYTEKDGIYVERIPYEIFHDWIATDRDSDGWEPGWQPEYIHFYYASFGATRWAAAHLTGTVLGSGRKNVAISTDGGNTWNVGSTADDYGGNHVVGIGFASENIAFMSFDPYNEYEGTDGPVISRTMDGGKTWELLDIPVPPALEGQKLVAGTPYYSRYDSHYIQNELFYPVWLYPSHGEKKGEPMYLVSRDRGITWSWDSYSLPAEVTQYVVDIPMDDERDYITVAGVYGKGAEPHYPDGGTIHAGKDGTLYYVMGVSNDWWSKGNFKTLRTYRVTSQSGYLVSVEEVETFTKDTVLKNGKPYTGPLDGMFSCQAYRLKPGNFNYDFWSHSIYIQSDGSICASAGMVGTGGPITYEGTYQYDVKTGEFTAKLTGRYASNGEVNIYPESEVKGKLYEYGGFVHFVCESSEVSTLTVNDPIPLTFVPNTDGYATPAPVVLDDVFDGVWEGSIPDGSGTHSYSLSILTESAMIQLDDGIGDGTDVSRYVGTYTVNPLTMVNTAVLRSPFPSGKESEFTIKFTLGYSKGSYGTNLYFDIRACDAPSLQHLVGKTLVMQQVVEPIAVITDIADWDRLPWSESWKKWGIKPASGAYHFIYNLVSGNSEIPEYNGLGIRDYSITIVEDAGSGIGTTLSFTFTVTGNSLPQTLLPGTYTWMLLDGMELSIYTEGIPATQEEAEAYWKRMRGLDRFEGNTAVQAVNTYLSWMPYIYEVSPYGKWDPENYHLPYNYICAHYGNEGLEIRFDEMQRLMSEKFGITVERPKDNRILSRCEYNKETDTVRYADTRGYSAVHKILDIHEEDGMTYVIVQLFADRHRIIPSHKVQFAIGEGDVFLGSEIIQIGKYAPRELS
ncbi:MAG: hypothetical protein E7658_09185 [Ruminococcaceae bacterium]|nr:hypothetical protein [Oscillospiraceae bacterium]